MLELWGRIIFNPNSIKIYIKETIYKVHGILQARIPSFRGSSQRRDQIQVSHTVGGFFTVWAHREAQEYWSG